MAAKGYDVLITSTYRDIEKQNALYAQGRTAPGAIVTNAKGGYSNHNFRAAFDICKNVKGGEWADTAFFKAAGAIWEEMGGVWGGRFTNLADMPHFEFLGGLTTADFRAGKSLANNIKMKWEADKVENNVVEQDKKTPGKEGAFSAGSSAEKTPSDWAKEAWEWAIANKITDGTEPRGAVTREMAVTMLYRALKTNT
jgi:peptidoglycan L-alanyl-D-glutamate endopeptidase CwlK